jgi:cellulose synthase/poly-beta-1,6-N-acetylglucosamine synthase-like glycosyltransferase
VLSAGSTLWHALFYVLATLVVSLDLLDMLLRAFFRRRHTRGATGLVSTPLRVGSFTPYQVRLHLKPFALLASLHNAEEALDDFLEAWAPFRDRLWVIDDASTDGTWFRLQRAGVHAVRSEVNRKKPGAVRDLVGRLPADIETIVVLDPDVRLLDSGLSGTTDLERVVFEFQRSRRAAASPRFVVRPDGWLARLQSLEYGLALGLGRASLRDHSTTSGVALYRRDALERALSSHTLSVYAEDLRNALILLGSGETIYYDARLVFETEGKRTWKGLFSQRVGWHYGLLKVYAENFVDVRRAARGGFFRAYQFLGYLGGFGLLLHPLRVLSLLLLVASTANGVDLLLGLDWIPDTAATEPAYFLFAYVKYTVLVLGASAFAAADWAAWRRFLPVVPLYFFYILAQIVPTTVGYLNWFSLRLLGRRIYRDHYNDEEAAWRAARA